MENDVEITKLTEEKEQKETTAETAATTATPTATKSKAQSSKEDSRVDFEVWYSIRSNKIPTQHHKEIIKADFKGRKVPALATMAEFDSALKKYGITLK
jgi:uncharacterized protein YcbX